MTSDELDGWLRDYGAAWEARDGDRGFARWWSSFTDGDTGERVELDGVFVLDFGGDGLCGQLQEWWLAREAGP